MDKKALYERFEFRNIEQGEAEQAQRLNESVFHQMKPALRKTCVTESGIFRNYFSLQ